MKKNLLKKLLVNSLIAIFLSSSFSLQAFATSEENCFTDVEPGDEHYVAICSMKAMGLINGYEDKSFKSYQKINRVEALKMITTTTGFFTEEDLEIEINPENLFPDTPEAAWYISYLLKAKNAEIIRGYSDGKFRPEKTVTLAETLKLYAESSQNIVYPPVIEDYLFPDTPEYAWYAKYIAYASSRTVLNIYPSNKVYPEQEMTRGEVTELLYRFLSFGEGYEFGKASFYGKALQGNYTASGEIFDYHQLTAAHKTLPFGTVVEVRNLANNKSVEVRITDRGPYTHGRVIDLSEGAFEEIAWLGTGIIHVEMKTISKP